MQWILILGLFFNANAKSVEQVGNILLNSSAQTVNMPLFNCSLNGGGRYGLAIDWDVKSAGTNASLTVRLVPNRVSQNHWTRVYKLDTTGGANRVETTFLLPDGEIYKVRVLAGGELNAGIKKAVLCELPRLTTDELYGTNRLETVADPLFEPIAMCHHIDRLNAPAGRPAGWGAFTDSEADEALDILESSPTQWVRITMGWGEIEPQKGSYNQQYLARLEKIMDRLDAAGIRYYIQIGGTAGWASSSTEAPFWNYPPKDLVDWENIVRFLGERYGNRTCYWEILNEPDWHFWNGTVDEYAESLRRATVILKEINPEIQILHGGLSSDGVLAGPGIEQQWLQKMFDRGAGEYIDIFSQHMYTETVEDAIYRVNRFYNVMKKNGHGHKPLWLTEIGMSTFLKNGRGYSEDAQKKYLIDLYSVLVRHPKVEKIFWYNLRNKGTAPDDKESNFGIFLNDLSPRPAGNAYLQLEKPEFRKINRRFLSIDGL